jgi:hypothetical protein
MSGEGSELNSSQFRKYKNALGNFKQHTTGELSVEWGRAKRMASAPRLRPVSSGRGSSARRIGSRAGTVLRTKSGALLMRLRFSAVPAMRNRVFQSDRSIWVYSVECLSLLRLDLHWRIGRGRQDLSRCWGARKAIFY